MIENAPALVLVLAIGAFVVSGVYLLLERSLTRVLIGFLLLGNGANLLFLVASGRAGGPPIVGDTPEADMSDPLPQAMVLTAIVITLGICAFVLAMAYRSWQLHGHDEVQDDVEDRRIARLAAQNQPVTRDVDVDETGGPSLDEQAAQVRDETGAGEDQGDDEGEDDNPSSDVVPDDAAPADRDDADRDDADRDDDDDRDDADPTEPEPRR